MKIIILFSIILFICFSCQQRLDSFLFNPTSIETYMLDDYMGEKTFEISDDYDIHDSLIHIFSYMINDEGESKENYAIYVGDLNSIDQDTIIMYCHGNRDHMDFYWNRQKLLAHVGGKNRVGVLSFDYPGYGRSEGVPNEVNMYESTRQVMNWLVEQGVNSSQLYIYGYSLGSAPATKVCGSNEVFPLTPQGLILENPFASSEVMVQSSGSLSLPDSYFTDVKIENAEEIKKVNQPFLWMYGTADDFLTVDKHGQVVYDHYNGTGGEAVLVDGATHDGETGVPKTMGLDSYLIKIEDFIGF